MFFYRASGPSVKYKFVSCYYIVILFPLMLAFSGNAAEKIYGVASVGYANSKFDQGEVDSGSFKLGVGYQFHPQWYAELGFQQLSNQNFIDQLPMTLPDVSNFDYGMQGDAIFASLLGKASGRLGELYYRVGIVKAEVKGQHVEASSICNLGTGSEFSVDSGETFNLCEYDEGSLAGVFGIGFDFYIGVNMMLRTEVEHISGENGLQTNAGYVGLRYNF